MDNNSSEKFHCTMTPINLVTKNVYGYTLEARTDYIREKDIGFEKWDDTHKNSSKIGDYFIFVRQLENTVEIYKINNIIPAINRPDYWIIEEHRRRNVLYLSTKISDMSWSELKLKLGYKENFILRGTLRSSTQINI